MARLAMPEYSLITWGPGLVRRLSGHAIGSQGYGDGQLNEPFGVATLRSGRLAVADTLNHRVVLLDAATGVFERTVGSIGVGDGQFIRPVDVAALPGGRLAVADAGNSRVVLLGPGA